MKSKPSSFCAMAEAHGNPTSSLRRCAGMCRVGQMKYIVPIIVGITFVLTAVLAEKRSPRMLLKVGASWLRMEERNGMQKEAAVASKNQLMSNISRSKMRRNSVRTKSGSMAASTAGVNIRKRSDAI